MNNIYYIQRACDLASTSVHNHGGPFGCVIVDDKNEIIAEGHNRVTLTNDPTAHAEIVAIRNACATLNEYSLKHCRLYSSCEPCPMCLSAIYWARIPEIYYAASRNDAKQAGFDDSLIYDELGKSVHKRMVYMRQYRVENACSAFESWKTMDAKTEY